MVVDMMNQVEYNCVISSGAFPSSGYGVCMYVSTCVYLCSSLPLLPSFLSPFSPSSPTRTHSFSTHVRHSHFPTISKLATRSGEEISLSDLGHSSGTPPELDGDLHGHGHQGRRSGQALLPAV